MILDAFLAAVLLAFGAMGYLSGATRQIAHWAALVCGALAAPALAARATPLLAPNLNLPPTGVEVLLSFFFFCVLSALTGAALRRLLGGLTPEHEQGRLNSAGGFVLGVGKGGAMIFALISVVLFFEKPLSAALGKTPASIQDSAAVAFVRRCDLFEAAARLASTRIEKLVAAARDPQKAKALSQDPRLRELLDNPALQALLHDDALSRALKTGDLAALKNDPRLAALFQDPRLAEIER